jgi:hypothetical protein
MIDGCSLLQRLGGQFDLVSCLVFFPDMTETVKSAHRLLLEEPADFANNRRSLYICPECGDLSCGAVTLVVEQIGGRIVWRDFGYENDYDDELLMLDKFSDVGPFSFDKDAYHAVIQNDFLRKYQQIE